jgi:hypothetical protein
MFRQTHSKLFRAALTIASALALFYNTSPGQQSQRTDSAQLVQQSDQQPAYGLRAPGEGAANPSGAKLQPMPDLSVSIEGVPAIARAGEDIGPMLKIIAGNNGGATAVGTSSAVEKGYMIDLVLSTDNNVPEGFAIFSPSFAEDVLLRGGRVSNTQDLARSAKRGYPVGAGIPADTPKGTYLICARIDPGSRIAESDETNNVSCVKFNIVTGGKSREVDPMPSKRPRNP